MDLSRIKLDVYHRGRVKKSEDPCKGVIISDCVYESEKEGGTLIGMQQIMR